MVIVIIITDGAAAERREKSHFESNWNGQKTKQNKREQNQRHQEQEDDVVAIAVADAIDAGVGIFLSLSQIYLIQMDQKLGSGCDTLHLGGFTYSNVLLLRREEHKKAPSLSYTLMYKQTLALSHTNSHLYQTHSPSNKTVAYRLSHIAASTQKHHITLTER